MPRARIPQYGVEVLVANTQAPPVRVAQYGVEVLEGYVGAWPYGGAPEWDPILGTALTFPGTNQGSYNYVSPGFQPEPSTNVTVHVVNKPNYGGNIGVICSDGSDNHYTTPEDNHDYTWTLAAFTYPKTYYVYSWTGGSYKPDLTGSGTFDYVGLVVADPFTGVAVTLAGVEVLVANAGARAYVAQYGVEVLILEGDVTVSGGAGGPVSFGYST